MNPGAKRHSKWLLRLAVFAAAMAAPPPAQADDCNTNSTTDAIEPAFSDCDTNGTLDFCDVVVVRQKLDAPNRVAFDQFGNALAFDGDLLVAGNALGAAPGGGNDSGTAYVYRRNGTSWIFEQRLTASDPAATDQFGSAVAVSGDLVAVGVQNEDDVGSNGGAAYVYRRVGGAWQQLQKITAADGGAGDNLGAAIAVQGDTLLIGAPGDDDAGNNSGAVYQYKWNVVNFAFDQKLTLAPAILPNQAYGRQISLSGDRLLIGASTLARMLVRSGLAWTAIEDTFTATHIRFDGETYIGGMPNQSLQPPSQGTIFNAGRVLLTSWSDALSDLKQDIDLGTQAVAEDRFGSGVGVHGDIAFVGVPQDDDFGSNAGTVRRVRRLGSAWALTDRWSAWDPTPGDQFGSTVAYRNYVAAISAPFDDDGGTDSGTVYIFGGAPDCDTNGRPDACDLPGNDCNTNGLPDQCDPVFGDCDTNGTNDVCETVLLDCNTNRRPDACEAVTGDCDTNTTLDTCEIAGRDCNENMRLDTCDLGDGAPDCDTNARLDDCELGSYDCNTNETPDVCDITCDLLAIPSDCLIFEEYGFDCNHNDTNDVCEGGCNSNGIPDQCELSSDPDCNTNRTIDLCDIAAGSADCDTNGQPDACAKRDCNTNGVLDRCDIDLTGTADCNTNVTPDACEPDCNTNGLGDACDTADGRSPDCSTNHVPDECEGGDCNTNLTLDGCDEALLGSVDCDFNQTLDECEFFSTPLVDVNSNGTVDLCECIVPIEPDRPAPADGANGVDHDTILQWNLLMPAVTVSTQPPTSVDPSWALAVPPGQFCGTQEQFDAKMAALGLAPRAAAGCPIMGDCDDPAVRDAYPPVLIAPYTTIRLSIHMFCNDDGSGCFGSEADVRAQVDTLNENYRPWGIRFVYDVEFVNSTMFRNLGFGEEFSMKALYADAPQSTLNVYVVNNLLGYSQGTFPWDPDSLTYLGGIILTAPHFGPEGTILAHEVGHCLGLWHTHHGVDEVATCGACYEQAHAGDRDTTGDFCADTPATTTNFNCAEIPFPDFCNGQPFAPTDFRNYMGYAPATCVNRFTPQQASRMHCWIAGSLSGWQAPGSCPPHYDVYFDTVNPPVRLLVADTPHAECDPGRLNHGTTYFWRVRAGSPLGEIFGPVWTFTTATCAPPQPVDSPSPPHEATAVPLRPVLSWTSSDHQLITFDPDAFPENTILESIHTEVTLDVLFSSSGGAIVRSITSNFASTGTKLFGRSTSDIRWCGTISPAESALGAVFNELASQVSIDVICRTQHSIGSLRALRADGTELAAVQSSLMPLGTWQRVVVTSPNREIASIVAGTHSISPCVTLDNLQFKLDDCLPTYDIYFDDQNPPATRIGMDVREARLPAPSLSPGTEYFWQVVARMAGAEATSTVWSFTAADVDCNTNGTMDHAELAQAPATDCNTNQTLDACDPSSGLVIQTPQLSPFHGQTGGDREFQFTVPQASGYVTLDVSAQAFFNFIAAAVDVRLNGVLIGTPIIGAPGQCKPEASFNVDPVTWNAALIPGVNTLLFDANFPVQAQCFPENYVQCTIRYGSTAIADCNTNDRPDECDLAAGLSGDCDTNGTLDQCQTCGDFDHDHDVDGDDFGSFLNAFGAVPGQAAYDACADVDGDGVIGFVDYQRWMQCYRAFVGNPAAAAPTPGNLGDLNADGAVDGDDIGPFVAAVTNPQAASFRTRIIADVNTDAALNSADAAAMAALLLSPPSGQE